MLMYACETDVSFTGRRYCMMSWFILKSDEGVAQGILGQLEMITYLNCMTQGWLISDVSITNV